MKTNHSSEFLGTEKISKLLFSFSMPAFIAMLASGIYNIVDTIFIGKGIGTLAVGGVGIVFPIQTLYNAFAQMISIGAASAISRSLGEKKDDCANQVTTNAYILTILISLLLMIISYFFINPILFFFGSNEELLVYAHDYLMISILSIPFNALALLSSAVFRAEGNIKVSMMVVLIGAVFNLALDPLFIFTLNGGIKGAAFATVIAQALASLFALFYIFSHRSIVRFEKKYLIPSLAISRSIISVGFSAFARNGATSLFALITNSTLRTFGGTQSITAFGTVNRIISFFFLPIMGINQGLQPIISYNYGARHSDRIKQALKLALIYTTIIGAIGSLVGILFPTMAIRLFVKDKQLISEATFVLRIQLLFYWTIGLQMVASTFYQSIGRAIPALFLSILRQFIILIPLIFILPRYTSLGINGVWYSFPISDFSAFLISAFVLWQAWHHLHIKNEDK
ncbi:MATE family efflux transporter [Turicibacter sp. TJ11]|uniref:MATE family efflux transporter n=1 Tax=Turicibacter sp. TJ11 TaxID=2806443 RepID=UPI001F485A01|nr:MATE family efflux transporter [Turicibacter sp. TJ11]